MKVLSLIEPWAPELTYVDIDTFLASF